MKLRKSPRLHHFSYAGSFAYNLTFVTRGRTPIFSDPSNVTPCLTLLEQSSERYDFTILAYCFMPDHLHLLVVGSEESSLTSFVRHFKQLSGFDYKTRTGQ